jgi:hypothetical protein
MVVRQRTEGLVAQGHILAQAKRLCGVKGTAGRYCFHDLVDPAESVDRDLFDQQLFGVVDLFDRRLFVGQCLGRHDLSFVAPILSRPREETAPHMKDSACERVCTDCSAA